MIVSGLGDPVPTVLGPLVEGASLELICRAEGGRPTPEIFWSSDNFIIENTVMVGGGSDDEGSDKGVMKVREGNDPHRRYQEIFTSVKIEEGVSRSSLSPSGSYETVKGQSIFTLS